MGGKKKEAKEKPLEKMTIKDLREIAKETSEIIGIHGMNKTELLIEIKAARGIVDAPGKKVDSAVRDVKKKISTLRLEQEKAFKADDKKKAAMYRRRISRLKKKTRRAA